MLDNSLASVKASQSRLQGRIEDMQNNAPDLGDMPAALDKLRDQLEELARARAIDEVDAMEYEYESTQEASTDTSSIE